MTDDLDPKAAVAEAARILGIEDEVEARLRELGAWWWVLEPDHSVRQARSMREWTRFWSDIDNRRVARDEIGDVVVSTVFLGLDHGFAMGGPPILFETMIFGAVPGVDLDQYQDRYPTWDDAIAGHARIVEAVRYGRPIDPENAS